LDFQITSKIVSHKGGVSEYGVFQQGTNILNIDPHTQTHTFHTVLSLLQTVVVWKGSKGLYFDDLNSASRCRWILKCTLVQYLLCSGLASVMDQHSRNISSRRTS
jgi:hypothetical protein